jgi:DNA-binding NtrC family response regulator
MSKRHRLPAPPLAGEDIAWLQRYDWPGNIRELQNVIERAVILSKGVRLRLDLAMPRVMAPPPADDRDDDVVLTDRECRDRDRANVMRALERTDGRIYGPGGAAELLGLNPTTLASRLRALKIVRCHNATPPPVKADTNQPLEEP